jgi:murein DD-endopeptidase MepM/ murein hydrolase activator NlpD
MSAKPFHPILHFPEPPTLLDLSGSAPIQSGHTYSIGRYNEVRGIYTQDLFGGERTIHMGIDLGAPAGTPVHAFTECRIHALGINAAAGDYGPTIVTVQQVHGEQIWALYGHLSQGSLVSKTPGQVLSAGEVLGWLGEPTENGGWPPHVHFQLSRKRPQGHDLPGAVSAANREQALKDYPDPRIVLGAIY